MIRVWAPRATRVEVVVDGSARAMTEAEDGWWQRADSLPDGVAYAFLLDGEGPFPDPRSSWQPRGVHGPSLAVDHAAFRWTDHGFRAVPLGGALFYELHVGAFSEQGTFDGVIGRLDHLVDLGVTHLSLMPVATFPGDRGWGYDGVDLLAPHPAYGGPDGLKRLVDAAHARGLGVIVDVVWNHLGPDGNYLPRFGPYLTDRYRTPWGDAVNLDDAGSDQVRAFLLDCARHWLVTHHADGLRVDAVHALFDRSACPFLEELAEAVKCWEAEAGRPLVLIAESDLNDPRVVTPRVAGGLGLDAQWSDDLHHALHAWLTGERSGVYADFGGPEHVAKALRDVFVVDGGRSASRGRRHGRPVGDLSGHRFLGYTQTHDQIGNRAAGERLVHLVGRDRALIAAALMLTAPHVPMLFMGEEWAASSPFPYFTAHTDPTLAQAVRDGRLRDLGALGGAFDVVPDPQDPATFASARLRWDECGRDGHREVLEAYRALIALRRTWPELCDGRREVEAEVGEGWLRVTRGRVSVIACPFVGMEVEAGELLWGWRAMVRCGVLHIEAGGVAVRAV